MGEQKSGVENKTIQACALNTGLVTGGFLWEEPLRLSWKREILNEAS